MSTGSARWPEWLPLRDALAELTPYGAPQLDVAIKLNTNESPFPIPPLLAQGLAARFAKVITGLNRYPDRDAIALRSKLAEFINGISGTDLQKENIWAANGSNEILQSIFLACRESALGFIPSYSVHPLIARITGTTWIAGERNEDFSLDLSYAVEKIKEVAPGLVFITTPNNPTGTSLTNAQIEELAIAARGVGALLVVDEAYAEFSQQISAVTLIDTHPNIVVSRTMSKAFAFAGVRVGYAIAHSALIDAMMIVRLPYHLSSLTQAAAETALDMSDLLLASVQEIKIARDGLARDLLALNLRVVPSDSNFILFSGFAFTSGDLWQRLVDRGILVRDVAIPGYLRVTVGSPAENRRFIEELRGCLIRHRLG